MKLSGVEAPWGQGTGGDGVMGDRVGQGGQGGTGETGGQKGDGPRKGEQGSLWFPGPSLRFMNTGRVRCAWPR